MTGDVSAVVQALGNGASNYSFIILNPNGITRGYNNVARFYSKDGTVPTKDEHILILKIDRHPPRSPNYPSNPVGSILTPENKFIVLESYLSLVRLFSAVSIIYVIKRWKDELKNLLNKDIQTNRKYYFSES